MVSIQLLGGFEITLSDGARHPRVGAKPKALLAFLAVRAGKRASRGRLAGLLWGDRDEDHARHSLSQALTTIRATLGSSAETVLRCDADGLYLTADAVEVDVVAFERAARGARREELEEAFRLYRGAFLEGMDVREPDFEEWVLAERYRLAELAADAFARLLALQMSAGDDEEAVATARAVVALSPLDEAAHARLIELHGRLGRRGLAEAHFVRCADLLQRELDRKPGDEMQAALAEARKPAVPGRDGPWNLLAGPSIALMPFWNLSGDSSRGHVADGLSENLITDLSRFSTLFVVAVVSSPRDGSGAPNARQVARKLRVRYVVEGSVHSAVDALTVDVHLLDATSGRLLWTERYERPDDDPTAQREISRTIAAVLGSGWGEIQRAELDRVRDEPVDDLDAYGLYLWGVAHRHRRTKDDNAHARALFEKAMEADPSYARAMAECSLTYIDDLLNDWSASREEWMAKAEELARGSTEIDASEAWGFVALGLVLQLGSRSDEAISLLETAHALNPNDHDVTRALGHAVAYSGAPERGVELLEQAQRLNPYRTEEPRALTMAYFFSRRYEDALATIARSPRRPDSPAYLLYKAASHAKLGQLENARAAVAEALALDSGLTVVGEHRRRLAMGLGSANAAHLSSALRRAGLPER